MFKALNDIYTPVLKLMKLFESYDGHTNLKQFEHMPAELIYAIWPPATAS